MSILVLDKEASQRARSMLAVFQSLTGVTRQSPTNQGGILARWFLLFPISPPSLVFQASAYR
ncbi:hypothetical protein AXW87_07475 [Pseudomonas aeruginosa]|nr:hypothetical protein CDG41_16185 [Pseudomonas aeruginosa]ASD04053.1 hypothetical protein CD797_16505 [Pseudomonas aeruginosa]AVE33450.1 hypothetical protein HV91_15200 [Pseudomonas aeruginosa]AVE36509.1 hypothetical protein HV91_31660 [Pseudomonas aeruginosa]KHE57803.1 hypothetical protein D407_0222225 [Pseudomonas aeruginosa]